MFKLVVLSAIFAAAAAKPGLLALSAPYAAPIAYSSVLAPASTSISQSSSSVVHPSPAVAYSAPIAFTHFIKKRSAPLAYVSSPSFIASHQYAAPLAYSTPLATAYSAPGFIHGAPILSSAALPYAAAHLIKKRSAAFLTPTTYAASAPLLTSAYTTPIIHSAPLLHSAPLIHSAPVISQPIAYTPHFIKKRSAPLITPVLAPAAVSHQSRLDYTHTSPVISTTYTSPITYHGIAGSYIY